MNEEITKKVKELDSMKVAESLTLYPEQIKESWGQAQNASITKIEPRGVIICGMGGSSNAGKIVKSLFKDELGIPVILHNDYGLPSFANKETLVVLNSYSGNTEETLSAYEPAKEKGSLVLGVTSGGKLAELIKEGEIEGVIFTPTKNPTGFPKTGLGVSLGALLGALVKAGVVKLTEEELFKALDKIEETRRQWLPENLDENLAFKTAKRLKGKMPVFLGAEPLGGSLQAGRNAMDEISRNFTLFFDFPEVNHILIEATQKPEGAKNNLFYLFFESEKYSDRVQERMKITSKIFDEQGVSYDKVDAWEGSKLFQALLVPNFCAWLGFYLAILGNDDPGPEPWIIKLKNLLGQPPH